MTTPLLQGFPPIVDDDAWVLILGSFPSAQSLAAHQYYANPRNAFRQITSVHILLTFRWTHTPIVGMFHNRPAGIKTGEIIDVEDVHAKRYVEHEMAELVDDADAAAHF